GLRAELQSAPADDPAVSDYVAASREAARLSGPAFARVFQLDQEPASRRAGYGGEFGQRCLLARRLVEAGVRFVEVSHNLNFLNRPRRGTPKPGHPPHHELIPQLAHAPPPPLHAPS